MNISKNEPLPSFKNFGPYGEEYDAIFHDGVARSSELWKYSEYYNGEEFHAVVRGELSLQSLWANVLSVWGNLDSLISSHTTEILQRFGMFVLPPGEKASLEQYVFGNRRTTIDYLAFRPREELALMPEYRKHYECDGSTVSSDLNSVCFGPFSDFETAFIGENHPKLFEVGAGTMYAASHFRTLGLDVLAVDVAAYTLSKIHYPWQTTEDRSMLAISSYRELLETESADRTLLMSWPQPQAGYPGTVLELYRKSGGKNFLFKLGALFGEVNRGLGQSSTPVVPAAKWKIIDELIEHWEINPRLSYEPWMNHNAMIAFRLRE